MREHRYTLDMPHSPERLWALFQDYPRWTEYAPMVLDIANTGVARGKIYLAKQKGLPIPLGWAIEAMGEPTTDPQQAIDGIISARNLKRRSLASRASSARRRSVMSIAADSPSDKELDIWTPTQ